MTSPGSRVAAAAAACVGFAIFVTWPQALHLRTTIAAHDDAMFSIWRLAWIAHALRESPTHLLDGNIFSPAVRTLTFSDATLLESAIGAPLLWARISPVFVYNALLLGGIAASGLAMFVLARSLTGRDGPALVAAAVFEMAPYRIEHFMHLELQWAMWIPLTFWALHRAIDAGSDRAGALAGVFLFLQIASCVYYGVFLAIASTVLVPIVLLLQPHRFSRALRPLAWAAAAAAVLTAPYASAYLKTAALVGPRHLDEVASYSATPIAYLAAPPQNWLWGWTARWGYRELSLYPGIVAVGLAVGAVAYRPRRLVFVYAALAVLGIELSFGLNGSVYPRLLHFGLSGLRSPARAAILAYCAIAMLAAFGVAALQSRCSRWGRTAAGAAVVVAALFVGVDGANAGMYLMPATDADAPVYRAMRAAGPGVLLDLPPPLPERLPGHDAQYQYWSISHWHPLINGYSGYYPAEYLETLEELRAFPDETSIARLKRLGVRYVIVHRALYDSAQAVNMLLKLGNRRDFQSYGTYKDAIGAADLFVLAD